MANKTPNFNLDLPTGDELFNPLWPNSNTTKIDAQMKKNMDNSVTKADCVFNTNKFIITREDKTGKIFKFIAPNDYVAGYTFTVDGSAMDGIVAGTGDALADGCFMNGHEVIAYIDETTASLAFLVGSSLPDAIDATTLDGHGVDYFATAAGLAETNQVATSAGQVANQALEAAGKAGMKVTKLYSFTTGSYAGGDVSIPNINSYAFFVITYAVAQSEYTSIACIPNPFYKTQNSENIGFELFGFSFTANMSDGFAVRSRHGTIKPQNNVISFEIGKTQYSNTAVTTYSTVCAPLDIYGIG